MRLKMRRWNPTEDEFSAFLGLSFWSLGQSHYSFIPSDFFSVQKCKKRGIFSKAEVFLQSRRIFFTLVAKHRSNDKKNVYSQKRSSLARKCTRLRKSIDECCFWSWIGCIGAVQRSKEKIIFEIVGKHYYWTNTQLDLAKPFYFSRRYRYEIINIKTNINITPRECCAQLISEPEKPGHIMMQIISQIISELLLRDAPQVGRLQTHGCFR